MTQNYLLITPCKNEGKNLPLLIDSIAAQTIKPIIWVIIDDGSTDNTPVILKQYQSKYNWIRILCLKEKPRDIGLHLAKVMKKGFYCAIDFCKKKGLEYEYLGNVDGDLILPSTFFQKLLKEFEKDFSLGIASGGTKHIIGDQVRYAKVTMTEPSGGHMLIRKKCFEDIGNFPISYSLDSVLKAKARLRGWRTKRFEDNIAVEIRDVNAAEGYWKGYFNKGKDQYYLNFNPIHIIIKSLIYSFRKPYYIGIAFFTSYLFNFILRKQQIDDDEVKKYFGNKWHEVIKIRFLGSNDEVIKNN